jgi:hypothetical protein
LYVVISAHVRGAASTDESFNWCLHNLHTHHRMKCPGTCAYLHVTKSLRLQDSQWPQWPPCHPTATLCLGFHWVTYLPTLSITPAISWPGTLGYWMAGNTPSLVKESLWQMPHAYTLIRTCVGPGSGISLSTSSKGPLALETWIERMYSIV